MKTITIYITTVAFLLLSACNSNSKKQSQVDEEVKDYYREQEKTAAQKPKYTVITSGTDYKLTRVMASSQTYTTDSVVKNNYTVLDDNALVVINLIDTTVSVAPLAEQLQKLLEGAGATNVKITPVTTDKTEYASIDQVQLNFLSKGNKLSIYLAIASNGRLKVLFQGSAHSELDRNMKQFKEIAHSISFVEA